MFKLDNWSPILGRCFGCLESELSCHRILGSICYNMWSLSLLLDVTILDSEIFNQNVNN